MNPSELSKSHLRRLKRKHAGWALASALVSMLFFGVMIYFAAWLTNGSFHAMIVDGSPFLLLMFLGGLWGRYSWLNYKAGIGPEVADPDLNEGP